MASPIQHYSTVSTSSANLTPAQAQVVQALAAGRSISAAARTAQVHRSTIHIWLKDQPGFAAAVEAARENFRHELNDELLDLAADALQTVRNLISDKNTPPGVRLKAALAILERPSTPDSSWNLPVTVQEQQISSLEDSVQNEPTPEISTAITPISRSAPCPCGSGQKYKRCCGRNAAPVLCG